MTDQMLSRFVAARRSYIARQFSQLNPMQQEAVLTTDGPLLLLAGAGSGKTTVLINRIANLIRFGSASDSALVPDNVEDDDVVFLESLDANPSLQDVIRADNLCLLDPPEPSNILAVTFTNKAANELRTRLVNMLWPDAERIWAMTFHAACCRILRKHISLLGYTERFTVFDTIDSERMIKDVIIDLNYDPKVFTPKSILHEISRRKEKMLEPYDIYEQARTVNDDKEIIIGKIYESYQNRLKQNNAVDFDDIILLTVKLLRDHALIRNQYRRKFKFILVDEFQDTNRVQAELIRLLLNESNNLCVVGDDDQSIYRFRGATIENILDFEKQYRGARVIRLEQNYRSTQSILNAANAVIAHNLGRKGKRLWTANGTGDPVTVYEASDEGTEASFVASRIISNRSKKIGLNEHAILYRTNAQSNALEYAFKRNGIPYKIIGGTRFFDRAEIKDMLAYLCVINNRADDLRLKRIINNPPRGLGTKTIETAERLSLAEGKALYDIVSDPYSYGPLEKPAMKLLQFTALIESLAELLDSGMSLPDFYDELLYRTGYAEMLELKPTEDNKTRLENVKELKSSILAYVENSEMPTLAGFLEEIALYTDIEQYNEGDEAVVMMTMHSAKGLEFPHVFLVGFEDGLFPGMRAIGDVEEMEEERRLCYVAITRAKETLTISHARQRMLYGRTNAAIASRFLREIPEELVVKKGGYTSAPRYSTFESETNRRWNDYSAYTAKPAQPSYSIASTQKTTYLELNKGDMVHHAGFGKGMVLSVMKMGGDALLEIAFDQIGTKKLMAKTASAHMKKL